MVFIYYKLDSISILSLAEVSEIPIAVINATIANTEIRAVTMVVIL